MGFSVEGTGGKKRKAHVVVVSFPGLGHCGPFIQIFYLLDATYPGVTVTYVADKDRVADVTDLQTRGEFRNLDLRTEALFSKPVYPHDPKFPIRGPMVGDQNFHDCEAWRTKLLAEKGGLDQPTVIVSDMFEAWSKDLADDLGIPWYVYLSVCPLHTLLAVESPRLVEAGLAPQPPSTEPSANPSAVLPAAQFPGLPWIRVGDMANELFEFHDHYARLVRAMRGSAGVLLNTADELDRPAGTVTALQRLLPSTRVLAVGPSLQMPGFGVEYGLTAAASPCLDWLDGQPDGSVLYIAFGTLGAVPTADMAALASGIQASGARFLWAVRLDPDRLAEILPPGFVEQTNGRGRVETGWVPQTRILTHRATGGFLSHSGWNSTLESISAGVPIISWPLGADQPLNARGTLKGYHCRGLKI